MQGIATLQQPQINPYQRAADMLADFGREGDTYIVHAAEGETVIPVEVLDKNPRMKQMIFKQMEEMGLDPQRYIVGSELNSINPVTGQPEFFLKKLFKSVKKVVKKIAPIALPIVAPYLLPTMPLAFASGLGSFVGNKIGGASTEDALKGALLTGGIAGLGAMAKTGSRNFLATGEDVGIRGLGSKKVGGALEAAKPTTEGFINEEGFIDVRDVPQTQPKGFMQKYIYDKGPDEGLFEKYFSPNRKSIQPLNKITPKLEKLAQARDAGLISEAQAAKSASDLISKAVTSDGPGMLAKYGPLAALGLGGVTLASSLSKEDEEPEEAMLTGQDLIDRDREEGTYRYAFDPTLFYGNNPYYRRDDFSISQSPKIPMMVREGGEIVGPGTGTSDSVPAMLSDGEFVMTANAVKGAGGGDRQKGAKKMYAMMKQYERTA